MSDTSTSLRPAAFLDRDGVINVDHGYLYRWEDFEFMPGAVDGMRELAALGYALVVITNQSGIGRGFYTEDDFWALTEAMRSHLKTQGVELSGVYFSPYHPEASIPAYRKQSDCRKPAPGMLIRAAEELQLDFATSVLIGDKASDIEAGAAVAVGRLFQLTDGDTTLGAAPVTSVADMASQLRDTVL